MSEVFVSSLWMSEVNVFVGWRYSCESEPYSNSKGSHSINRYIISVLLLCHFVKGIWTVQRFPTGSLDVVMKSTVYSWVFRHIIRVVFAYATCECFRFVSLSRFLTFPYQILSITKSNSRIKLRSSKTKVDLKFSIYYTNIKVYVSIFQKLNSIF